MKNFSALFLAFIFIFLTACSAQRDPQLPETAADAPTALTMPPALTAPPTTAIQYVTSWGTDLIPDGFPAPPPSMSMYSFSLDDHEEALYPEGAQVLTLTFNCTRPDFVAFSNALKEAGYKGGFTQFKNATYYRNGLYGAWQNGQKIITIAGSVEIDKLNYTVMIEIADCYKKFPSGFKDLFPEFEGYTTSSGTYNYKNAKGEYILDDVPKDFSGKTWQLVYSPEDLNSFTGVTEAQFKDYCNKLSEMGFKGEISIGYNDGVNILAINATKESDGNFLGVSLLFTPSIGTLDALFSNDKRFFS